MDVVLDVVLSTDRRELRPVDLNHAGTTFHPLVLLALVTYSYSVGVCASEAIASRLSRDAAFRSLCGNSYPDWHSIRRFRRDNRAMIERCLERVCFEVWRSRLGTWEVGRPNGLRDRSQPLADRIDPMICEQLRCEVKARIDWGVRLDCMAIDE